MGWPRGRSDPDLHLGCGLEGQGHTARALRRVVGQRLGQSLPRGFDPGPRHPSASGRGLPLNGPDLHQLHQRTVSHRRCRLRLLLPRPQRRAVATTGATPDVSGTVTGVTQSVRHQSSSAGHLAPAGWLLCLPSRSASTTCEARTMKSRACGRLLVRRLEREAAGASGTRFVAVAGRPTGKRFEVWTRRLLGHESGSAGTPAGRHESGDRQAPLAVGSSAPASHPSSCPSTSPS